MTYNENILAKNQQLLSYALARHAKVLLVRFDVRYPDGYLAPEGNALFITFMERYIRYLSRKRYSPLYLWCRERANSSNPHYHVYLLLDGTRLQKMPNLYKAEEIWQRQLELEIDYTRRLLYYCNYPGSIILRNDQQKSIETLNYLAYLAKEVTKEQLPGVRNWGSSYIPAN